MIILKKQALKLVANSQSRYLPFIFKKKLSFNIKIIAVVSLLSLFQTTVNAKVEYVSIGTGGLSGVYYPTGGAICYLVNQVNKSANIRCEIKSTPGSIYNFNALKDKYIDIAVVQSDWQYHFYNGTSLFEKQGKFENLRTLFSVHSEPFTVLAREDANINSFADIKGKRINIGVANSGQRATMDMLFKIYGWNESDFAALTSLRPSEQAQALCDDKIDAMVYVVGHPNSSIKEASSACHTKLLNVEGPKISKLINDYSYYDTAVIPGGMYRDNPEPTETFGVGATIVTTTDLPEIVAYEIVKTVFENHEKFIQLHPSFKNLTKEEMVSHYLSAPLHPGALRYFKEVGLIKEEDIKKASIKKLSIKE